MDDAGLRPMYARAYEAFGQIASVTQPSTLPLRLTFFGISPVAKMALAALVPTLAPFAMAVGVGAAGAAATHAGTLLWRNAKWARAIAAYQQQAAVDVDVFFDVEIRRALELVEDDASVRTESLKKLSGRADGATPAQCVRTAKALLTPSFHADEAKFEWRRLNGVAYFATALCDSTPMKRPFASAARTLCHRPTPPQLDSSRWYLRPRVMDSSTSSVMTPCACSTLRLAARRLVAAMTLAIGKTRRMPGGTSVCMEMTRMSRSPGAMSTGCIVYLCLGCLKFIELALGSSRRAARAWTIGATRTGRCTRWAPDGLGTGDWGFDTSGMTPPGPWPSDRRVRSAARRAPPEWGTTHPVKRS